MTHDDEHDDSGPTAEQNASTAARLRALPRRGDEPWQGVSAAEQLRREEARLGLRQPEPDAPTEETPR